MTNASSTIADLRATWHNLHDLDRDRAVYAIQQDGTSVVRHK